MSASVVWLKPVSKFVLEVSPLVSALLIAAYLVSSAYEGPHWATTLAAAPEPDTAMLSGEDLTMLIKDGHAAVAAENREQQAANAAVRSMPAAPAQLAAATPHSAKPAMKAAHTVKPAKPATDVAEQPAIQPPAAPTVAPPQQAAAAPERGILRRTWGTVANWSGTVAHVTKIDYAADVVAETPSAVARAGRKTWQAFTSILPDDPRR